MRLHLSTRIRLIHWMAFKGMCALLQSIGSLADNVSTAEDPTILHLPNHPLADLHELHTAIKELLLQLRQTLYTATDFSTERQFSALNTSVYTQVPLRCHHSSSAKQIIATAFCTMMHNSPGLPGITSHAQQVCHVLAGGEIGNQPHDGPTSPLP